MTREEFYSLPIYVAGTKPATLSRLKNQDPESNPMVFLIKPRDIDSMIVIKEIIE